MRYFEPHNNLPGAAVKRAPEARRIRRRIVRLAGRASTSFVRRAGPEGIFWTAGLLFLALQTPSVEPHFTLCPFALAGFTHCPGCGLGRSISFLLHGDVAQSIRMHLLGIPACIIILARCASLVLHPPDRRASLPLHTSGEPS